MKGLIRSVLFTGVGIFFTGMLVSSLSYSDSIKVLIISAAFLTLANFIVKPIIKIVTLPINLITLGIFSWLIDVFILYLVTIFINGFSISAFNFGGANLSGFIVPAIYLSKFWATVLISFFISLIVNVLNSICD